MARAAQSAGLLGLRDVRAARRRRDRGRSSTRSETTTSGSPRCSWHSSSSSRTCSTASRPPSARSAPYRALRGRNHARPSGLDLCASANSGRGGAAHGSLHDLRHRLARAVDASSLFVAFRLWRAGHGQPTVVRYRMRLLAVGAIALAVVLVLAGAASSNPSALFEVVSGLLTLRARSSSSWASLPRKPSGKPGATRRNASSGARSTSCSSPASPRR